VAKSAFNHSVNYRSVIVFSEAQKHDNYEEKYHFFKELTEKIVPKSWEYLRPMTESEVNKTMLLSFDLSKSSSKIRSGQAVDEPEDEGLSIWSGLIPLSKQRLEPISNSTSKDIPVPNHLKY
jgi:nitroimidazol reductase NimA-like FMN-containing flavoprotein (pyridoxamine 5'-phosphate oxidase superfamily)